MYRSTLKACALILPGLAVSGGCAQLVPALTPPANTSTVVAKNSSAEPASSASQLIAVDLVNAMVQVNGLQPGQTELRMREHPHSFGKLLHEMLLAVGYRVNGNGGTPASQLVSFSITDIATSFASTANRFNQTYQLNVGDVRIRRDYGFSDDQVKPLSHLYVRGADSSGLKLNDRIFEPASQRPEGVGEEVNTSPETVNMSPQLTDGSSTPSTATSASEESLFMQTLGKDGSTTYRVGELIEVSVMSALDSQLYCYYQDGLNNIVQVLPNRFTPDNVVRAGQTVSLPGSDLWQLTATRAGVPEQFMCIAVEPEATDQLAELSSTPDLQSLPVESLQQIFQRFKLAAGAAVVQQSLRVAVN